MLVRSSRHRKVRLSVNLRPQKHIAGVEPQVVFLAGRRRPAGQEWHVITILPITSEASPDSLPELYLRKKDCSHEE